MTTLLRDFRRLTLPRRRSAHQSEANLKITALEAYGDSLEAKNNAIVSNFVPLDQARALRDQLLYENDDSRR